MIVFFLQRDRIFPKSERDVPPPLLVRVRPKGKKHSPLISTRSPPCRSDVRAWLEAENLRIENFENLDNYLTKLYFYPKINPIVRYLITEY